MGRNVKIQLSTQPLYLMAIPITLSYTTARPIRFLHEYAHVKRKGIQVGLKEIPTQRKASAMDLFPRKNVVPLNLNFDVMFIINRHRMLNT